jgi:hypothetical protein
MSYSIGARHSQAFLACWRFRRCARCRRRSSRLISEIFQVIFDLMVVLDPGPHLLYLLRRHDATGGSSWPQGDGEIPHWPMPLAFGALAGRISAGDVSFHQRTAQRFGDRRELLGQTLAALTQGQFRKSPQLTTCLHLSAGIRREAHFAKSESPRMRIPPYFTDSEGNPFPVRSSCYRLPRVPRELGMGSGRTRRP